MGAHKISIIIPTMGNLDYLKLAIESLQKNTIGDYEILVHANEVRPEVKEYAENAGLAAFTFSHNNQGIAEPVNRLAKKATGDIIAYWNDDIYAAYGWNYEVSQIMDHPMHYRYLTICMFEPQYENICMNSPISYGKTVAEFDAAHFESTWRDSRKITKDIISSYGPAIMTKELWDEVKGFDERYYPGFATDPDIVAKIYFAAKDKEEPYEFRGISTAGLYHFQCITTSRLHDGFRVAANKLFHQKWGIDTVQLRNRLGIGKVIDE